MKILHVEKKIVSLNELKNKRPSIADFDELITEDCLIKIPNFAPILYKILDMDAREIIQALNRIKFFERIRLSGLVTQSETIGYKVRNKLRHNACELSALANKYPYEHDLIMGLSKVLSDIFKEYLRPYYRINEFILNKKDILQEYKILETVFTSGIINKNSAMGYHVDRGNIPGMLSCMLVFKNAVSGGFLSLPEIGKGLECCDCSAVIFNGQRLIHGVTPIQYANKKFPGYRYSIVFYSMHGMWDCLPPSDELDFFRKKLDK